MNFREFTGLQAEMDTHFIERTNYHIDMVKQCCKTIADNFPEYKDKLLYNVQFHDKSKFDEPEKTPYVYISWKYKCKDSGVEFEIPSQIKDICHSATTHHVLTNRHHPEFWDGRPDCINKNDRDEVLITLDGTRMPDEHICEMVGDWAAVSIERDNSIKAWADKNVNKRWKFTPAQVDLIYRIVKLF